MKTRFPTLEPQAGLYERIVARLHHEAERSRFRTFVASSIATLVSFVALIPSFLWFVRDIFQTGFAQSFSLLFSDGGSILAYWHELGLSLLESLPFASLITFLVVILAALISSRILFISFRSQKLEHKLKLYA